jgi:hypothetical protein
MGHHSVIHRTAHLSGALYSIALAMVTGYFLLQTLADDIRQRRERRKKEKQNVTN